MPFFTHLQLGLLCRDERVARVCELLAARRVKSSLHLYSWRRYGKSALSTLTGTRSIADDNQVYA